MPHNVKRSTKESETEVGQKVVDGLQQTLAWMKAQFDVFRTDVKIEKSIVIVASSHSL